MKLLFRRIRGALGMSAMWALSWAALSPIATLLTRRESGEFVLHSLATFVFYAFAWGTMGAISGLIFGLCLATDARPNMRDLSVRRAAVWGGLSAALFPFAFEIGGRVISNYPVFWFQARMLATFAMAGAISGATIVAIARSRALKEPPELDIGALRELGSSVWPTACAEPSAHSTARA